MSVDLPAPFSPHKAWTSPGRRSKSTPRSARTCPKRFTSPRASSTGPGDSALPIDFLARVKAVLHYGRVDIVFGHGHHIEQDRRHLALAVVELGFGDHGLAGGERDCDLRGTPRQRLHRLVDAHRLLARDDALHCD